jgi:hypothetical protein
LLSACGVDDGRSGASVVGVEWSMSFLGLSFSMRKWPGVQRVPNDHFSARPFGTLALGKTEKRPRIAVANITNHTAGKLEIVGEFAALHLRAEQIAQHAPEVFVAWE